MKHFETYNEKLNTIFDKNEAFYQHRLVIKIGSSTIMSDNGQINHRLLDHVAWQTSELMDEGYQIAIVTSGAVACGRRKAKNLNGSIVDKQVLASVGQRDLENAWGDAFDKYNRLMGYSLYSEKNLTDLVADDENPLIKSLNSQVVQIINANDAVNRFEIEQLQISSDNDRLAGFVARRIQAQRLILLTEESGVWDKQQQVMEGMTRWSDMEKIFVQEKTKEGTGGMESKVEVAMSFALHGRIAYIARGLQDRVLLEIISGRSIGTRVQLKA